MTGSRAQRGDSKLGCIFWLVILAAGALVAWKAIPVKIRSAEFHDFLVDQAVFATREPRNEAIKKRVLEKAGDLELPVTAKQVEVHRSDARIRIVADYTVPLDFPFGYTYEWQFHHDVDRPIFYY
jgi:hypothetical protein